MEELKRVKSRKPAVREFEMRCRCGVVVTTDMECPECGMTMKIVSLRPKASDNIESQMNRWPDESAPRYMYR